MIERQYFYAIALHCYFSFGPLGPTKKEVILVAKYWNGICSLFGLFCIWDCGGRFLGCRLLSYHILPLTAFMLPHSAPCFTIIAC